MVSVRGGERLLHWLTLAMLLIGTTIVRQTK